MMTPIDRSMPAVRITSVCPTPRMPVTITWVRIVEKLLAAVKRDGLTRDAEQQAEHQHDEGNGGRIDVEEALQTLQRREPVFLEGRDRGGRAGQAPARIPAEHAPLRMRLRSCPPPSLPRGRCVCCEIGARDRRAPTDRRLTKLSSRLRAKSTPAELHALVDGDRGNAGHRVVGDQLLAGVDALRLLAGLDELRPRPRRRRPPSAADIAARWRR